MSENNKADIDKTADIVEKTREIIKKASKVVDDINNENNKNTTNNTEKKPTGETKKNAEKATKSPVSETPVASETPVVTPETAPEVTPSAVSTPVKNKRANFVSDTEREKWHKEARENKLNFVLSADNSTAYNAINLTALEKVSNPKNISEVTAFEGGSYNDAIKDNIEILTRYSLGLSSEKEFEKFYKEKAENPKSVMPNSLQDVLKALKKDDDASFNKLDKSFKFIQEDKDRINANFDTAKINDFNTAKSVIDVIEERVEPKKTNTLGITFLTEKELEKFTEKYPDIEVYKDQGKNIFVDNQGKPVIGTANKKFDGKEVGIVSRYEHLKPGISKLEVYDTFNEEQVKAFEQFATDLNNHIDFGELSAKIIKEKPDKKASYSAGKLYVNKNLKGYEKIVESLYSLTGKSGNSEVKEVAKIMAVEFAVRGLNCFSPEIAKRVSGQVQMLALSKLNLIKDENASMDEITESAYNYTKAIYSRMGVNLQNVPSLHSKNGFYYKPIKKGAESFKELFISPYTHDEKFKKIINVNSQLDNPDTQVVTASNENQQAKEDIEFLTKFEKFPDYNKNLDKWMDKYSEKNVARCLERDSGEKLASLMNKQINLLFSLKNKMFFNNKLKKAISDASSQLTAILGYDRDGVILSKLDKEKVNAILGENYSNNNIIANMNDINEEMSAGVELSAEAVPTTPAVKKIKSPADAVEAEVAKKEEVSKSQEGTTEVPYIDPYKVNQRAQSVNPNLTFEEPQKPVAELKNRQKQENKNTRDTVRKGRGPSVLG